MCQKFPEKKLNLYLMARLFFLLTALWMLTGMQTLKADAPFFRLCGNSAGSMRLHSLFPTADKGMILCGTYTDTSEKKTAVLVKTDSIGTITWARQYGSPKEVQGFAVKASPFGGYLMLGEAIGLGADSTQNDFLLIKTDLQGQPQWARILGGNQSELPGFLEMLPDGSWLVGGSSRSAADTIAAYAAKLSANGDLIWQAAYTGGTNQHFSCALPLIGGDLALGGSVLMNNGSDFFLVRINAPGDTLLSRMYGLPSRDEQLYSMVPGANAQITLAGMRSINTQFSEAILLRINANADTVQVSSPARVLSSKGMQAQGLFDGSILLSASIDADTSLTGIAERALLCRLSAGTGNLSKLVLPYNGNCEIKQTKALPNGGFVCSGFLPDSLQAGSTNGLFIRSNPQNMITCAEQDYTSPVMPSYAGSVKKGCTVFNPGYQTLEVSLYSQLMLLQTQVLCGKQDPQGSIERIRETSLMLYPNPAREQITLSGIHGSTCTMYDARGMQIQSMSSTTSESHTLDISKLLPGVYYIRAGEKTARFIKQP